MVRVFAGLALSLFSFAASAGVCEHYWFHLGGVSKHVQVYEPNEYTRYKRQTHPGVGLECENDFVTVAAGEFTNSLDRPFSYLIASRDVVSSSGLRLMAGFLTGEYGLTERAPLKVYAPIAYLEYRYRYAGINLVALPPMRGLNDYAIFFAQFKVGF